MGAVTGHDCPCGVPHELTPDMAAAYGSVTAGPPSTVTVSVPQGTARGAPHLHRLPRAESRGPSRPRGPVRMGAR